jgi:hypothetical protein
MMWDLMIGQERKGHDFPQVLVDVCVLLVRRLETKFLYLKKNKIRIKFFPNAIYCIDSSIGYYLSPNSLHPMEDTTLKLYPW